MQTNNIFNLIYEQEGTAPLGMWDKIALQLDVIEKEEETPVFAIQSVKPKLSWLKIALAACAVGFVTMTSLWFVAENNNKKNNNNSSKLNPSTFINNTTVKTITDTVYLPSIINAENTNNTQSNNNNIEVAINSRNNTTTLQNKPTESKVQKNTITTNSNINTTNTTANNTINNSSQTISNENNIVPKNIVDVFTTNPATLSGPISNGDKAISSILNKISLSNDNEEIDSIINKSAYWKVQIQTWRNQLIKSGYAPSLINHMDIIELLKLLGEKNN